MQSEFAWILVKLFASFKSVKKHIPLELKLNGKKLYPATALKYLGIEIDQS